MTYTFISDRYREIKFIIAMCNKEKYSREKYTHKIYGNWFKH